MVTLFASETPVATAVKTIFEMWAINRLLQTALNAGDKSPTTNGPFTHGSPPDKLSIRQAGSVKKTSKVSKTLEFFLESVVQRIRGINEFFRGGLSRKVVTLAKTFQIRENDEGPTGH
jgi:hypothetical protein